MPHNVYRIEIALDRQRLTLWRDGMVYAVYPVSTARNGAGERLHSECTPRGRHRIAEKFGDACAIDTVFVARQPTGEIFSPALRTRFPDRDWILTRILRLDGEQEGVNRGSDVDTFARMIYIHGSPDDVPMGVPGSHGCIRMRNRDVIELYELVPTGTEVSIHD